MDKKKREKREEATVYKSGQSALHNLNYINQFIGSLTEQYAQYTKSLDNATFGSWKKSC